MIVLFFFFIYIFCCSKIFSIKIACHQIIKWNTTDRTQISNGYLANGAQSKQKIKYRKMLIGKFEIMKNGKRNVNMLKNFQNKIKFKAYFSFACECICFTAVSIPFFYCIEFLWNISLFFFFVYGCFVFTKVWIKTQQMKYKHSQCIRIRLFLFLFSCQ